MLCIVKYSVPLLPVARQPLSRPRAESPRLTVREDKVVILRKSINNCSGKGVTVEMILRKILPAVVVLVLAGVTYAQEPKTPAQDSVPPGQEGPREGRRPGRLRRHDRFDRLRELNLTDEQRQQQRAILQRHLASTKAQREELFQLREKRMTGAFSAEDEARAKALRQEIQNSMEGIRTEMESILTAEQRAKLEQLKLERKERREEMRERRRELRERREPTIP